MSLLLGFLAILGRESGKNEIITEKTRKADKKIREICRSLTFFSLYELKRNAFEFSSAHIRSWAAAVRLAEDSK